MHYTTLAALLTLTSVSAIPTPFIESRQASGGFAGVATFNESRQASGGFAGVATFNDYVDQVANRNQPTVCGDFADDEANNIFAAAAGDLSPDISPGQCDYDERELSQDLSLCEKGQQPNEFNYQGPSCSKVKTGQPPTSGKATCGQCYKVTNNDTGKSVTIRIVDACPALSAFNYCKTELLDLAGKCAGDKNALDISVKAYPILANTDPSTGATGKTDNLNNLSIAPLTSCSG